VLNALVNVLVKELPQVGTHLLRELVVQSGHPRLDVRAPAEVFGLEPHHAAPRDSGGRSDFEILHLEQSAHRLAVELDALAVWQAQRSVVVEHGVHRLDPDSVDRPVKHDPLARDVLVCDRLAHEPRAQAVLPLASGVVELAVQLAEPNHLRVEHVGEHLLHLYILGVVGRAELRHRPLKRLVRARLAAAGRSDKHDAEAHHQRLVELDNLQRALVLDLQALLDRDLLDRLLELAVVLRRDLSAWEKVGDQRLEQDHVV